MADLIDLETLPQLSRNDLMRAGNMIYRLLQNSGTDFDRELDKYSRKKAYRILIQEYGKIVQRELQKKESTLNSVVAEGIPYSEFLYNEMSFVQNIVTEIKPGPSLIEEIYLAEVNDGKFEDYTSKNLLLSIRYRLMAILEPEKREYLEKGYTHLSKIKWQDHNFTLRENFFRQKFLDAIRNELPGETDFYSRVAGILEKQSLEVVNNVNEATIHQLKLTLDEEKLLKAELQKKQEDFSKELSMAKKIQQSLLPRTFPARTGLKIYSRYIPVASVGGDFFDVAIFPDALGDAAGKRVGLLVSDVSGHGVPAAFIALMAKIAWQQGTLVENTPSGILRYLNSNLLEKTSGHFLTAFLGIFDMSANTLQYSSGGHIPPVLLREGRPIQDLDGRGSLIGLLPMIKLEDKLIEIQRGDRFVFFTDGLFEARTGQKDLYGMENLSALFDAKRNLEGEEFCDQVICSIRDYIGNTALEDDVTLVVVDVD